MYMRKSTNLWSGSIFLLDSLLERCKATQKNSTNQPCRVITIINSRPLEGDLKSELLTEMTGKFREGFTSLFKLRQRYLKYKSTKRKTRNIIKDDITASEDPTATFPDPSGTWQISVKRLMKELCEIQRYHATLKSDPPFTVDLVNDNLFEWYVRLYQIDADSALASDMRKAGLTHILLHLIFPYNFPFSPPFMYVVTPAIENGYVMSGGAICMELLMPRGWACSYTAEAVIMQFAATVTKGQGRLADSSLVKNESSREKAEKVFQALLRMHEKHGWVSTPRFEG